MGSILPTAIRKVKHLRTLDETAEARLALIPPSTVQVYNVGTVDSQMLYWLASAFGVLGYAGWAFAATDAQKRELIRKATALKSKRGTPFAIKEALKLVGINNVVIEERLTNVTQIYFDGVYFCNGSQFMGALPWATFRVLIDISQTGPLNAQDLANIRQIVLYWKNVRSWLVSIDLMVPNDEIVDIDDESELTIAMGVDFTDSMGHLCDGTYNGDGEINFNEGYDDDLQIIFGPLQTEGGDDLLTEDGQTIIA